MFHNIFKLRHHRKYILALAIAITLCTGSWLFHKFYVSLTEIRYNPGSERLEVSMRIFPDDLDLALERAFQVSTHLATEIESEEADSLLQVYLDLHFAIEVDGEPVLLKYLGKEPEADAIWCYLESAAIDKMGTIVIRSSLLTEAFEEQVNIIQVYAGDWNRGMLLTREQTFDKLIIGK